jgi:alpha-amylase/alpha-mannosidase (GH57 family)
MERYLCIHGHFYQPPRENPWLEAVEVQDSAYPYHDWNERINFECYAPNAAARILNEKGWIRKIVNNYTRISFNFGPTLLDWLEINDPEVYQAIIDADRESRRKFSGHGSAIAQAYNHMIMPLANRRDKYTQVIWGIRDFEKRFGRRPEGMWLPETAVDLETLEIMAEHDINFTILTPYQARRFRSIGSDHWQEVGPGGIDPTMPYQLRLPGSGRVINIFFYNGPISQAVAFEHLLSNGERFAQRLLSGFTGATGRPQLVHIATDGETYGHHHRFGEMALAYALDYIESNNLARITNYGEFLEKHPPTHEVEIHERTAWSCAHGVERWQADCGCNSGARPGYSQAWRAPLRNSLNWLRNTLAPQFEQLAGRFLRDPWAARNDYIDVILDRSPENVQRFLAKHAARPLNDRDRVTVLKLMEMQRHAMLMFTSCGWFFDEISGIETIQILQYARRVIQLAEELFELALEPRFLDMLARAKSNVPELGDGARIYEKLVRPAMVDLPKVGAHYAISSLFEKYGPQTRIFCYTVDRLACNTMVTGEAKLTVGQARITSEITRESALVCYGAVYFGYHNVNGGVRVYGGENSYLEMVREVTSAFNRADLPGVIRLLDHYFEGGVIYSLREIFRDQQRKILNRILDSTLAELEADFRKIYDHNAWLMRFLKDLDVPLPHALHCAADFYLNTSLRRAFGQEEPDLEQISVFLKEAEMLEVKLDSTSLGYVLEQALEKMAAGLLDDPANLTLLKHLDAVTGLARSLPFEVNLWKVQNIYYRLAQNVYPEVQKKAGQGDVQARTWLEHFTTLGEKLRVQR